MVNRKEVALDDPAGKYLREHVTMPERSGKSITLLDLATHTSGLPRLPGNMKVDNAANPYVDYSLDDLYQFLSGYTLPRDPGSEFEYSNLGAGLLGHLLAYRA
jgi:CubicO group peptidase (beta-lactamase class C family)